MLTAGKPPIAFSKTRDDRLFFTCYVIRHELLTLNGTQVEALSWELEPSNGQVFIHISRASIELLKLLAGEPKIPSDSAQWKSGYFGLMPICGLSGKANGLEFGMDGQHSFSRVQ